MRRAVRWSFLGIAVGGLFVWGACGGDDDGATPISIDAGGRDVALDTTPPRDVNNGPSDRDSAIPFDSGIRPPLNADAGPEDAIIFDVGGLQIPCVANGVLEVESNDTKETANTLLGSRCGIARIVPAPPPDPDSGAPSDAGSDADASDADAGDADAAAPPDAGPVDAGVTSESDFLTFRIPPTTSRFVLQFNGNVRVLVSVGDAAPQDLATSPSIPFNRDKPYFVEVRSLDGQPQTWRVTLFEQ